MADLIGSIIAFLMTVMVLSYLLGDNPFYRLAVHLFVGVTAGYAVVVVWHSILAPRLTVWNPVGLIGLALALLLVLRSLRMGTVLGSWVLALMLGVGAAVSIAGAVRGTLFPQVGATFVSLLPQTSNGLEDMVGALVMLVGTVSSLLFFHYDDRGQQFLRRTRLQWAGQIFIGTAFGAMYAGALLSSLAFFSQSLWILWNSIQHYLGS